MINGFWNAAPDIPIAILDQYLESQMFLYFLQNKSLSILKK